MKFVLDKILEEENKCDIFIRYGENQKNAQHRDRGPNVCVDRDHGYVCCTGWKISLLTGLCVISGADEKEANICAGSPCQQKCVVADGNPSCTCMPGFYLRPDGITCGDIDECQRYPFLCEQTCRNTIGSYMCTCHSNFTLTNNGRTCRRIHDYSRSPCANGAISNGPCGENSHSASNSNTEQPTEKRYVKDHHLFDNKQLLRGFPFKKGLTRNTEVDVSCGDSMQCFSAVSLRQCTGNQCDNTREIPVVDIQRGDCLTEDCLTSLTDGFVPLQELYHQASLCPNNEPCVIPENSMDCKGSNCLPLFDLNLLHSSPSKDQPPQEKVTKSDSREKKGRGGNIFASDDVMCRGDLCNDPVRRKQLLATHVPDKARPKTTLKIPSKTWTIPRTTSTETPLTIRVKTSFKTSVRKSSNTPVKTPSKKFSFCPIGYRPVTRGEFDFCEPLPELDLKRGALNKKESQVKCEDEQQSIITPEGQKCEKMHVKQVCPKGQLTMFVEDGIECVQLGKMGKLSACPPGYTPKTISDGIVCQFPDVESVHKCTKGRIPILSDSGFVCVTEAVLQPLCPDGFELAEGDDGLVCVAVDVCPSGEVAVEKVGGGRICQLMSTESPCPAGLIPVETPVGRLCQYVPPAEFQIVECPKGQVRFFHNGKATCVDSNGDIKCPPGQVIVETDSGVFCGFTLESCPPGQIEINGPSGMECQKYESRRHSVNPCPPDQELDQTGEISKCRYRQDRNKELQTTELCEKGQILTLFPRRFVCEQDILTSARRQCSLGTHVAIHTNEYICITDTEARMTCAEDEILTATGGTFSCLSNDEINILPACGPGEIPIENGQTKKCVRIEEGRALCNDGYKAIPTEDGFMCKSIKLQLECPPGFILTLQKGLPTCAGQTDIDCRTDDRIKNDCVSTEPTLNPCEDGYFPMEMDETYECWLEGEHPAPCGEEDGDRIRPCDIRLEDLKLQCNPECANGGTCKNGTCVCPDGITGTACQTDIDECVLLPDGHCEFRCENHFGGFSCVCPAGSTLNTDDRTCKGINCVPGCLNGGTCIRDTCACPPGLTGDRCQHDIDECTQPFWTRLCEHYCRNTFGSFACICPPGSRLQEDKKTCLNTTCIPACKNGGRCENHKCICPEGYQGVICQLDVNECYHGRPCSHICQNTRGSFRCACPTGYILHDDARTCEAISITKSTGSP